MSKDGRDSATLILMKISHFDRTALYLVVNGLPKVSVCKTLSNFSRSKIALPYLNKSPRIFSYRAMGLINIQTMIFICQRLKLDYCNINLRLKICG